MLSLRDPEGFLFERDGKLFRFVAREASERLEGLFLTTAYQMLSEEGRIVRTSRLESGSVPMSELPGRFSSATGEVYSHERIRFPSYPFEWHPSMLADAAGTTLDIALTLAPNGYTLKDATPYNVLFSGSKPVFVDLLSIDRQPDGYPYWLAEAQYVRTFALPLMAWRAGIPPQRIFLPSREGLESSDLLPWTRMRDWLSAAHWLYVRLPALFQPRRAGNRLEGAYRRSTRIDPKKASFIYRSTLQRHHALITKVGRLRGTGSAWSAYMGERAHYEEESLRRKRDLIAGFHAKARPAFVLDIGANTGEFSEIAAQNGSAVVALDSDLDSVGAIYARAVQQRLNILPLFLNFAAPSPGTGWRNRETLPFAERARKRFDAVLMLAVIHHLVVTEGIPLADLLQEVAQITTQWLVIEHVSPEDPMCHILLKGRDHLAVSLQQPIFESALSAHFTIEHRETLGTGTRTLYVCTIR